MSSTLNRVALVLTITGVTFAAAEGGRGQSAPLQGVPAVADAATFAPLATRVDPYVAKPRLIVLTDIANEPDDQMSFVRLLVSSNQFDLEGLVATTSRHAPPPGPTSPIGHRRVRQGATEPAQT